MDGFDIELRFKGNVGWSRKTTAVPNGNKSQNGKKQVYYFDKK
ncbi:hypothetical protein [Olsenella massiliensis]|nr:hypothetical protein [Olsenella massiliensis]